jgi:hypothetical protein
VFGPVLPSAAGASRHGAATLHRGVAPVGGRGVQWLRRSSPARALLVVGVLFLAVFIGGTVALLGGVLPAIVYTVAGFGLVVLFNPRLGTWLLVLLLPFAATYLIPRQVLGVTGLNPVNVLLASTLVGLALAFAFARERPALLPLPRVLLLYLAVLTVGAVLGVTQAHNAVLLPDAQGNVETASTAKYLLDAYLKPLVIVIVAWLVAVHARNGKGSKSLVWAAAAAATIFFAVIMTFLMVSGVSLDILASSRARGFLSWIGMHANELGLLMNMQFALLLFTALGMEKGASRWLMLAAAVLAASTAALTFSRAAFLGILIISSYFLITRRRFGQLLTGLIAAVVIALLLPDAFLERALTGFDRADVGAITAGRMDGIWRPLWPWVFESPLIGHGLGSTAWAPANRSGTMLPVGHPHSAYLGVLLDHGVVGAVVVTAFFVTMWKTFRDLSRSSGDGFWRGVFEGGLVCILVLLVQGITGDRFVPTYPQSVLWVVYGLALGHVAKRHDDARAAGLLSP